VVPRPALGDSLGEHAAERQIRPLRGLGIAEAPFRVGFDSMQASEE